jgi:hypothetical protein
MNPLNNISFPVQFFGVAVIVLAAIVIGILTLRRTRPKPKGLWGDLDGMERALRNRGIK